MKICKFCEQKVEKLVDSHIYPKAFFEYGKAKSNIDKNGYMKMFTNSKGVFPIGKVRIGWYDPNLVCANCEQIFAPYDQYAIKLLLKGENSHKQMIVNGDVVGWEIAQFDYKRLKLFIISVLWRAGASNLPQFKKISLGANLLKAKTNIRTDDPGDENNFSFILARFADNVGLSITADPHPESKNDAFGDLKSYRFYLGAGYIAYVKIDKKPFPPQSLFCAVTDNKPLIILRRGDFVTSKELPSLQKTITDANKELVNIQTNVRSNKMASHR